MKASDGGKGSSPRPYSVDMETFDDNWNRIFKPTKTGMKRGDTLNLIMKSEQPEDMKIRKD